MASNFESDQATVWHLRILCAWTCTQHYIPERSFSNHASTLRGNYYYVICSNIFPVVSAYLVPRNIFPKKVHPQKILSVALLFIHLFPCCVTWLIQLNQVTPEQSPTQKKKFMQSMVWHCMQHNAKFTTFVCVADMRLWMRERENRKFKYLTNSTKKKPKKFLLLLFTCATCCLLNT